MLSRLAKKIKKAAQKLRKVPPVYYIGFTVIFFLLIFFGNRLMSAVIAVILFLIGSVSTIYRRFLPFTIGFELITFTAIIYCFAYNPSIAWIAAIIMTLISSFFIGGTSGASFFIKIFTYGIMAVSFYFFAPFGILVGGMGMVILYNALTRGVNLILGANPIIGVISFVINIIVNYFLLSAFGSILASIM